MTNTPETPEAAIAHSKSASEIAERATHPFSDVQVRSMRTVEEIPPQVPLQDPGTVGEWLLMADAAFALGVSVDTVKRRLKLGRLEGRKDRAGRWHVLVPATEHVQAQDSPDTLTELAVLRARVADLEREREQLVADREAWREQAHRSDVHLQQLTARLPGLPDPADG